jgi:hypothetical protein
LVGLRDFSTRAIVGKVSVLRSRADGRFHFRSIVAEPYPIPHDAPVGKMLTALDLHPWRPAHLHFTITAPGYERLVTRVFRDGDPIGIRMQYSACVLRWSRSGCVTKQARRQMEHVGRQLGGRPMEVITDMTKSRKAGFLDYQSTPDAFFALFDRLKAERIIPQ